MRRLALTRGQVVLVALAAVAYVTTRALLIAQLPPFWDESLFAAMLGTAHHDFSGQAFIALGDAKGPLQTWLGLPLLDLGFGALTALRVLSASFGAVTVVMTALIAFELTASRAVAVTALALAALLPFQMVYDSLGLVDSQVTAFVTSAVWVELRMARAPSARKGLVLGVLFACGLLTKANAVIAIALLPLSLLLFDWTRPRGQRLRRWSLASGVAVGIAVAANLFMRLSSLYPESLRVASAHHVTRSLHEVLTKLPSYLIGNATTVGDALWGYFGAPLLVAALAGVLLLEGARPRRGLFAFAWAALVLVGVVVVTGVPYPRYWQEATPAITVLGALALVEAVRIVRTRVRVPQAALGLVVMAAVCVVPFALSARVLGSPRHARYPGIDDFQYHTGWPAGTGLDRIAAALRAHAPAGLVTVASDHLAPFGVGAELGDPRIVFGVRKWPSRAAFVVNSGRTTFLFANEALPRVRLGARFIVHEDTFPNRPPHGRFRVLVRYHRGDFWATTVTLLERVGDRAAG